MRLSAGTCNLADYLTSHTRACARHSIRGARGQLVAFNSASEDSIIDSIDILYRPVACYQHSGKHRQSEKLPFELQVGLIMLCFLTGGVVGKLTFRSLSTTKANPQAIARMFSEWLIK